MNMSAATATWEGLPSKETIALSRMELHRPGLLKTAYAGRIRNRQARWAGACAKCVASTDGSRPAARRWRVAIEADPHHGD